MKQSKAELGIKTKERKTKRKKNNRKGYIMNIIERRTKAMTVQYKRKKDQRKIKKK